MAQILVMGTPSFKGYPFIFDTLSALVDDSDTIHFFGNSRGISNLIFRYIYAKNIDYQEYTYYTRNLYERDKKLNSLMKNVIDKVIYFYKEGYNKDREMITYFEGSSKEIILVPLDFDKDNRN